MGDSRFRKYEEFDKFLDRMLRRESMQRVRIIVPRMAKDEDVSSSQQGVRRFFKKFMTKLNTQMA